MENNGPEHIAIKRIGEVRRVGWTELGLGNLELIELPKELCNLVVLRRLYLSPNKLTSLPSGIGNLINLNELVVRDNKLASLPSEIGQLANLWSLEIRENQLTELPSEIVKLENLEKLDVSCNKLLSIPSEIGKLKNLKRLIANNLAWEGSSEERNNLTFLPPEIRQLEKLEELDLRGNPLPIPPEILEKYDEPQTILNYYFSIFKINMSDAININTIEMEVVGLHVGKRLNETKLLVVGQGSVGKTSLIQQILHGKFDKNQIKTEGISINQWAVNTSQSEIINPKFEIRLNIWDFGGQEIMHATHQFFLTKRSLYLLVLDSRLTQEENRVEYWLKIIQSFGGESPALIIGNKIDQHPLDIDRTGLQKKYPNIIGILETSAATGAGIKALKAFDRETGRYPAACPRPVA